jgi:hypothetical protein
MTDTSNLDMKEQLIRIDKAIAETRKLQHESDKYAAETRRLDREYRWFPWLQLSLTVLAAIAAIAAALIAHAR